MKMYTNFLALVLVTIFSISTMTATTLPVEDITIGNTEMEAKKLSKS